MAIPVNHRNLLKNFAADPNNLAWARDLVCLAVSANGQLTDDDKMLIWEECENKVARPSLTMPIGIDAIYPKVELLKLKHHHGVNALAENQEIEFCNEGITLLYGQNKSGKSGYFRVLNRLTKGLVDYDIHKNIYNSVPSAISVSIDYIVDGMARTINNWDGVTAPPVELRHVRCFDSQYATRFLQQREGNTYLLESMNLRVFRAINETLRFLIDDMGASVDPAMESALTGLCSIAYRDSVAQALQDAFEQELIKLGMPELKVRLEVGDLLDVTSQIEIKLFNKMNVRAVLSEAELKCAAIALFLAECDLMEIEQPMVFDDPVNSLDATVIQAFTNRLKELSCEVVVFTHNVLFMEALTDERQFQVYPAPGTARTSAKRHVLVYDVVSNATTVGFVLGRKKSKTRFYLDSANASLNTTGPITNVKNIVDDLRMAVEWCIDEVIFRGLASRRFKGSEQTDWTTMEAMVSAGVANVRDLKANYDALSGMGIHVGYSSYTAPPTPASLQRIHDDILRIYQTVYP